MPGPQTVPGDSTAGPDMGSQKQRLWQNLMAESQTVTGPKNNACNPSKTKALMCGKPNGKCIDWYFCPDAGLAITAELLPLSPEEGLSPAGSSGENDSSRP